MGKKLGSGVRLAATVILARPPLEVYLTRRSARSAFAPSAFVFPGGTAEDQDADPAAHARTLGLDPDSLRREFRATISSALTIGEPPIGVDSARALLLTALRELFEEAGILLACRTPEQSAAEIADAQRFLAERSAIRSGERSFAHFLAANELFADARPLTLFSQWITPPSEPRRYNTHFFFTALPPDQTAFADAHETYDGIWIAPARALEMHRGGRMHFVYPTVKHLERLRTFTDVGEASAFAREKPIVTIMPADAGPGFAIPAELENAW